MVNRLFYLSVKVVLVCFIFIQMKNLSFAYEVDQVQDNRISSLEKRMDSVEKKIESIPNQVPKVQQTQVQKNVVTKEQYDTDINALSTKISELEKKIAKPPEITLPTNLVESGCGKTKVRGVIQYWYKAEQNTSPKDTFRLRRAQMWFSGDVSPVVSWLLIIDPAMVRNNDYTTTTVATSGGGTTSVISSVGIKQILADTYITVKPFSKLSIIGGLQRHPFGMEGMYSSARLDFCERSSLTTKLGWAFLYDLGVTVNGDFNIGKVKILPTVGAFNGESWSNMDSNENMDFAGRLVVKPSKSIHLGLAHYNGKTGTTKATEKLNIHTGFEFKLELNPIMVNLEFAQGKKSGAEAISGYCDFGFKISKSFQALVRHDYYDLDTEKDDDAKQETTVGVNYFIKDHNAKIMCNYIFRGEEGAYIEDDCLITCVQVMF